MRWWLALLVACGQPVARPDPPPGQPAAGPTVDAPPPNEEERLAAIQKAMNELDEAAQGCWAAAATERFDIAGELTARIEIAAASAKPTIVSDTARNPKLASCLVELLARYRWAPPLVGQTIQLPFKFSAPDGQSVVDRRLVEWKGQGKVSVAVLLDENNTGNAAASMFELALAAGGSTGLRQAERTEVWYFLGAAQVDKRAVAAGDMVYVPKGTVREVSAAAGAHAVVVMVPGGREGTARAGALPTPDGKGKPGSTIVKASDAKTFGPATIYIEPATHKGAPCAASVLALPAGANVAEHVHEHETEMLYVLDGKGTMTIAGTNLDIAPTSVVQIPPNTKHAFAAGAAVRAVQIYTPAGPEQRFKKKP